MYDVDSGINEPPNLTEMVPVPEMEEMVCLTYKIALSWMPQIFINKKPTWLG